MDCALTRRVGRACSDGAQAMTEASLRRKDEDELMLRGLAELQEKAGQLQHVLRQRAEAEKQLLAAKSEAERVAAEAEAAAVKAAKAAKVEAARQEKVLAHWEDAYAPFPPPRPLTARGSELPILEARLREARGGAEARRRGAPQEPRTRRRRDVAAARARWSERGRASQLRGGEQARQVNKGAWTMGSQRNSHVA